MSSDATEGRSTRTTRIVPERDEQIGFTEDEEISWHQYFLDFKTTIWPVLAKQGFTYTEAVMFWRQEVLIGQIIMLREELKDNWG